MERYRSNLDSLLSAHAVDNLDSQVFNLLKAITMPEKTWGKQIERACRERGFMYYHTHAAIHSQPGYPDYHIIHPKGRAFYVEAKTEGGVMTDIQKTWRDLITGSGQEWHCLRPSDYDELLWLLESCDGDPVTHQCHDWCGCEPRVTKSEFGKITRKFGKGFK